MILYYIIINDITYMPERSVNHSVGFSLKKIQHSINTLQNIIIIHIIRTLKCIVNFLILK